MELKLKIYKLEEELTCYKVEVQRLTNVNEEFVSSLERMKLEDPSKEGVVVKCLRRLLDLHEPWMLNAGKG